MRKLAIGLRPPTLLGAAPVYTVTEKAVISRALDLAHYRKERASFFGSVQFNESIASSSRHLAQRQKERELFSACLLGQKENGFALRIKHATHAVGCYKELRVLQFPPEKLEHRAYDGRVKIRLGVIEHNELR